MMPTMKREQFEEMSFEELLEWAYDNIDDIHSEEGLIEMAKHEIDEENLNEQNCAHDEQKYGVFAQAGVQLETVGARVEAIEHR